MAKSWYPVAQEWNLPPHSYAPNDTKDALNYSLEQLLYTVILSTASQRALVCFNIFHFLAQEGTIKDCFPLQLL